MKSFVLKGHRRSVEVTVQVEDYIKVHSYDASKEVHFHYYLAHCDYENLAAFSSIDDLLKFAKANHIFRDYPKTPCPRPPETSDTALSSTDDVDGGILTTVSHEAHLVDFNNHLSSNCYCPCSQCKGKVLL